MTTETSPISINPKNDSSSSSFAHPDALIKLTSFGLSENEARVYIYLLECGIEAGGSKIASETGLHRQYVYHVLPQLLDLGLIEEVAHGKLSRYRAKPPIQIEKMARKKVVEAEEAVKELERFSRVGYEQEFEIIQGVAAMQRYEVERVRTVPEGSEQYFIGGASEGFFKMMAGKYEKEYAPIANRKKLKTYYIGYPGEFQVMENARTLARQHFEFRGFEKLPKGVVNMMVLNDTVSFYTFVNPPLLYVIKSQTVADNYRAFFLMLWDMGKE